MHTHTHCRPSTADRIGIWIFMIVGAAIVIWSAIATASRISQVLRGEGVPASAHLIDIEALAPIGPEGAMLPVQIDTATVIATELSVAGFGAAILGPVVLFATIATVVTCLTLLGRNSLRGHIFSRTNTRLVTTVGLTALVGFGIAPVIEGMVANDAITRLSAGDFTGYAVLAAQPLAFVLIAFAFGIVGTAYTIGARIQRETEGLV